MKKLKTQKIIVVSNIGSLSRKYFVFRLDKNTKDAEELFSIQFDMKEYHPTVKLENALPEFFEIAKNKYDFTIGDIDIFAERVVATGEYFLENKTIDDKYLEKLKESEKYNYLHTKSLINEIGQIFSMREICKKNNIKCDFKLIGISDSSFHSSISRETYTYGVKSDKVNHFRKYGYHGISMSEVANRLSQKYKNIIAIHLGGGGSVTAIKDGKSVYNSFGMTPVSGLINLTRSGDIDPLIVIDILERNKKSFRFLESKNYLFDNTKDELYEKSGLFALTGEIDMRDILANLEVKDKTIREKNKFALDVYVNKINEQIGVALSHLGYCDAIVLTGNILEKSERFRNLLLSKISWLNMKGENIFVVKTEEEKEIIRLILEGKFV